jgi:hypothetical protein
MRGKGPIKIRRVVAIAAALGVAAIPAVASASTSPTVYTTNYAGYYATGSFGNKVDFCSNATCLPLLAWLNIPALSPWNSPL